MLRIAGKVNLINLFIVTNLLVRTVRPFGVTLLMDNGTLLISLFNAFV